MMTPGGGRDQMTAPERAKGRAAGRLLPGPGVFPMVAVRPGA